MKKSVKILVVFFLATLVLASAVISAAIQIMPTKASSIYKTTEQIRIKSTSIICNEIVKDEKVNVYIVTHKELTVGDVLEDVRGNFSTIFNSPNAQGKLWDTPQVGEYDIIIDCIQNGQYDGGEKISPLTKIDFSVITEPGNGKVAIGPKNIANHSWQYDTENLETINGIIQVSLLAKVEDITLDNITLQAEGSGDDTMIESVAIYVDENSNGIVDPDEAVIGESKPAYETNNGKTTIKLDYILTDNLTENFIIAYSMNEEVLQGEYRIIINSIYGTGSQSQKTILFQGLPIKSGTTKVVAEKTCVGSVAIALDPAEVKQKDKFKVVISGLSGCDDKKALIKTTPCSTTTKEISSCVIKEEGCESELTALQSGKYYACVDKNGDGDFEDFGESSSNDLTIINAAAQEENNTAVKEEIKEESNETGDEVLEGITTNKTEFEEKITGEAVGTGLTQKITESSGFLVLLEVTLLLILFVLVMILFRLKPAASKEEE
jgi:hypothetical protein